MKEIIHAKFRPAAIGARAKSRPRFHELTVSSVRSRFREESIRPASKSCRRSSYLRNLFSQWLWPVLGTLEQLAFLLRRELSKQDSKWIQTLPSQTPRAMERKNSKACGPNRHFVKAATTFSRLIACSTLNMLLMGGI